MRTKKGYPAALTAAIFLFVMVSPQYSFPDYDDSHESNISTTGQQKDQLVIEKEGKSRASYQGSRSAWLRIMGQVLIGGLIILLVLLLVKKRSEENNIVGEWRMTFHPEGREPYSETYRFVGDKTEGEVQTEGTMRGAYHVSGYLVEWTFFTHASQFNYAGRFTSPDRMEGNAEWYYMMFPEKNKSGTWIAEKLKD